MTDVAQTAQVEAAAPAGAYGFITWGLQCFKVLGDAFVAMFRNGSTKMVDKARTWPAWAQMVAAAALLMVMSAPALWYMDRLPSATTVRELVPSIGTSASTDARLEKYQADMATKVDALHTELGRLQAALGVLASAQDVKALAERVRKLQLEVDAMPSPVRRRRR